MAKNLTFSIVTLLCILQMPALCQNLDWIVDCHYQEGRDYFEDVKNLENSKISREAINVQLRKQLPNKFLSKNTECIYEVIVRYGDDSIKEIFKKRMLENSEVNTIDDTYFSILEKEESVPRKVITKIEHLKGSTFKTFESYRKALRGILTEFEVVHNEY